MNKAQWKIKTWETVQQYADGMLTFDEFQDKLHPAYWQLADDYLEAIAMGAQTQNEAEWTLLVEAR